MAPVDEAVQKLLDAREKHRQRIEQINVALAVLGSGAHLDEELFSVELPKPVGVREIVLAVLADQRGELLEVGAIFASALERGWQSRSGNPRNVFASTLAKLADAGEIERGGRGQYRAPAQGELQLEVA